MILYKLAFVAFVEITFDADFVALNFENLEPSSKLRFKIQMHTF